jgi:hypothetical protein
MIPNSFGMKDDERSSMPAAFLSRLRCAIEALDFVLLWSPQRNIVKTSLQTNEIPSKVSLAKCE